jgi:hypothetical protein
MPTATLYVETTNDLVIIFNDTMKTDTIDSTDLEIDVYGSVSYYEFSWAAEYIDNKTIEIQTKFVTPLLGNQNEQVVVKFITPEKFLSAESSRSVNKKVQLSGYLFNQDSTTASKSLGQTTMIVFFVSVGVAVISSFGGNSMEIMWNLMNTLQLMYFLSFINVNFPELMSEMFKYLKYANADNEYMKKFTFLLIPEDKFERGEVNEKLGDKAFYVNSADKVPIIFIMFFFFVFVFALDKSKCTRKCKFGR